MSLAASEGRYLSPAAELLTAIGFERGSADLAAVAGDIHRVTDREGCPIIRRALSEVGSGVIHIDAEGTSKRVRVVMQLDHRAAVVKT